jgi:signal transduction histidine kinase
MPRVLRASGGSATPALRLRKQIVLRAGFGIVTALFVFATVKAIHIQGSLSNEAVQIYRRQAKQDEILYRLRRTLWRGANACRDFLLDPFPDRTAIFIGQLHELRTESDQFFAELDLASSSRKPAAGLKPQVEEFWNALESIPATTKGMDAAARYNFFQQEIGPRRSAAGSVVRMFGEASQKAFQDSEIEFAQTRRAAENRLFFTLGLSVLLGLLVAGFSLIHSEELERQAARQYEEVVQAKADLQQLSARLMQIQEEERTRLSRELHDEIVQTLATLRLEISRTESLPARRIQEIRERLESARLLAERAIGTTRNISLLLRPSLLDDLGLGPALQWQAEQFTNRTGIPCQFTEEGFDDSLPEAARTCVYRVLQEALHNCEKHAAATQVSISIRQSAGLLAMTVEDNGCGFEHDLKEGRGQLARFGLLGMRERATSLSGSLEVDSASGKGTCLTLRLPLTSAPAAIGATAGSE